MSRNHLKLSFIGNLGRDPEMRYTPDGKPVTSFSVAVNNQFASAVGETVKETVWIKASAWGKLAEVTNQYLKKGSKVYVEGRIKPLRLWDGQDGEKHADIEVTIAEIEFLSAAQGTPEGPQGADGDDSDIPF